MTGLDPNEWREYFVASIGAGAAPGQFAARILMTQLATIPAILGGLSLALGVGFGLHWLVVGAIFALAAGVLDAWVLLIEILR